MNGWAKIKGFSWRRMRLGLIVSGMAVMMAGVPQAALAVRQQGAEVRVTLISPGTILGELIGISGDKIVVQVGSRERTVEIRDIDTVGVVRESLKPLTLVIGAVAGGFIGFALGKKGDETHIPVTKSTQWPFAGLGVVIGGGAGYGLGILLSKDKVYNFRGETPDKINAAIEALRKKARVPEFR
ncbi:MAG: hypothetical protein ABSG19_01315 [Candidatus Aminicenantales bacterium]